MKSLRRGLEAWLASLDADKMLGSWFKPGSGPEFAWSRDGWDLTFIALPLRPEARGVPNHRPLAVFGPPTAIWVNDHLALREALAEKGSAYGDLDHPLLIAVNSFATGSDDSDTVAALYGSEQITFSVDQPELPAVPSRRADGYWLAGTWAHQHVAAVLIGRSVMPWSAARPQLTMWTHPDADSAVAPMAYWRHAQLDGLEITVADAQSSAATLFELPTDWPRGDAFAR